jgi:hypothetical protein
MTVDELIRALQEIVLTGKGDVPVLVARREDTIDGWLTPVEARLDEDRVILRLEAP